MGSLMAVQNWYHHCLLQVELLQQGYLGEGDGVQLPLEVPCYDGAQEEEVFIDCGVTR